MSIIVNGGNNPGAVTYNGTSLTKVVFNGTTVWEKQTHPQTLSQFTMAGYNGHVYSLTVRDSSITASASATASYSCSISGTIEQKMFNNNTSTSTSFGRYNSSTGTTTGLPSGYSLSSLDYENSINLDINIYEGATKVATVGVDFTLRITKTRAMLTCNKSFYEATGYQSSGHTWGFAYSSAIIQGPASLTITTS